MTHTQGKKKLIEIVFEYPHMLDLGGKDFKTAITKKFKELKETMFEKLKEVMITMI